ncbi:Hypothetical protein PENO1_084190 [Penicillium occitanis (nom. inval.)]|nr:Hypothetical protein PENO1_084190 [Penicillium occitanis (nom. inval.)]PCG96002.1 hypothetical protein PENOC_074950 [Penicillium occitanis (nom. inval.)]
MENIIVVVSALGTQGASVISACLSSPQLSNYEIRALTSNPTCDAATSLAGSNPRITIHGTDLNTLDSVMAAFKDATLIFANTAFNHRVLLAQGPAATQAREETQGLNIARAASQIPSLKHLIWSTLVDTKSVTDSKIAIPLFQSKIPAEKYLRNPKNGMVDRTTFLHVALYPSVFQRMPYAPIFVRAAQKYIITLPCSLEAKIALAGDETVNVGLIAHAIFMQPEKTLGKTVSGATEYLTGPEIASALSNALNKTAQQHPDSIPSTEVAYVDTTLESYGALWGTVGLGTGSIFKFMNDYPSITENWGSAGGSESILTPAELGLKEELRSVKQRFENLNWIAALA